MKRRKYILIVSLLFNAAFILSLVIFLVNSGDSRRRSRRFGSGGTHRLELAPETQAKLDSTRVRFRKELTPLWEEQRRQRSALHEILLKTPLDTQAIDVRLDSIGIIQTALDKKITRQLLLEKSILPPDKGDSYMRILLRRWGGERRFHNTRRDSVNTEREDLLRKDPPNNHRAK